MGRCVSTSKAAQRDQFRPKGARQVKCNHCGQTYAENEAVWGKRRGYGPLWWCKTPNCTGAGIGWDIFPTVRETTEGGAS